MGYGGNASFYPKCLRLSEYVSRSMVTAPGDLGSRQLGIKGWILYVSCHLGNAWGYNRMHAVGGVLMVGGEGGVYPLPDAKIWEEGVDRRRRASQLGSHLAGNQSLLLGTFSVMW